MNLRSAKKLHNGDEVTIKETGEIVTVISAYTEFAFGQEMAFVDVCSRDRGFVTLSHREIK